MYKTTFVLRQHTPIIHFQWHEKDATIRPTELKAKLDKWLINQLTKCYGNSEARLTACMSYTNESNENALKKWLKGAKDSDKSHPSFNYSVRLFTFGDNLFSNEIKVITDTNKNGNPVLINTDYPNFFGNQMKYTGEISGKGEEYLTGKKRIKRLTFHKAVQVSISSPFSDLITVIQSQFPLFLLKTNFGTRQGKGFGSFYLDKSDKCFPKNVERDICDEFDWKFDLRVIGNNDASQVKDLFSKIDLFYKTLRSGINTANFGGIYFKSLLFQYVKDKESLQWDKKTIKMKYFLNNTMSTPENETIQKTRHTADSDSPLNWGSAISRGKFLWRDLLGLSTEQQWKGYNPQRIVKQHFPTGTDEAITRFKSPIFFKPIRTGQNTFRVFFEVPKNIKDAFADETKKQFAEESAILGKTINIDISTKTSATWGLPFPVTFDFDDFLNYVLLRHPALQVHNAMHRSKATFNDLLKMKASK